MKFSVDPKIFEKFPGVEIAVLVIIGMDNHGHNEEIHTLLRVEEEKQKQALSGRDLVTLPEVASWREIYKAFGSNPNEYRPSFEALLRRVRSGDPLPQINNLVDLYNYLSIKYYVTAGAEDLDKVKGDISLTFSDGTEKGAYIGSDEIETCDKGEVIYKDGAGFICRRWNWREAKRTMIDEDSKNSVLVIERPIGISREPFLASLEEGEALLKAYLKAKIERYILSSEQSTFSHSFKSGSRASKEEGEQKKVSLAKKEKVKQLSKAENRVAQLLEKNQPLITTQLQNIIAKALDDALGYKTGVLDEVKIEHPKVENYGDYASNIALVLGNKLKMKPFDVAEKLDRKLKEYIRDDPIKPNPAPKINPISVVSTRSVL